MFYTFHIDSFFWTQIAIILCLFKLMLPSSFHILRGNHESRECTAQYGFYAEVRRKYDEDTYNHFLSFFNTLPFCAVLHKKVFVTVCLFTYLSPWFTLFLFHPCPSSTGVLQREPAFQLMSFRKSIVFSILMMKLVNVLLLSYSFGRSTLLPSVSFSILFTFCFSFFLFSSLSTSLFLLLPLHSGVIQKSNLAFSQAPVTSASSSAPTALEFEFTLHPSAPLSFCILIYPHLF